MRIATSLRRAGLTCGLAALAATAAMLPAAHAHASGGIPVADYRGLTVARRGDVMSIPGDTWKFYRADIDPGQDQATLTEVSHLQRYDGFVYQWHDTANGHVLTNPARATAPRARRRSPAASRIQRRRRLVRPRGLIVVREAMPGLRHLADGLIAPVNFGGHPQRGHRSASGCAALIAKVIAQLT
jgi:hypothetical protein